MSSKPVFLNLTPHDVNVYSGRELILSIPRSGWIARVSSFPVEVGRIEVEGWAIPINKIVYGDVVIENEGTGERFAINSDRDLERFLEYFKSRSDIGDRVIAVIVSLVVLQALRRKKIGVLSKKYIVVCPDTNPGSAIRDSTGRILGVKAFQIIF